MLLKFMNKQLETDNQLFISYWNSDNNRLINWPVNWSFGENVICELAVWGFV